ncbi:DUF4212 domain-containing protein [Aromatoleum diolicum]|uniref:DUF4212 domain-containing protein n=1 Tax=Aromatoleum diolicum TaxID=75796 RepID=A0ABX1QF68_9RHOO|nr:DUF4212 domain-containing protein [Aromatoleum diolicum]NMG76620.1 DUF4212 domain-containing protein [Aromatoleum diolicum]
MKLTERHRAYWRSNLWLTFSLLSVWFLVSFVAGYYADELNRYSFMGFPLGFYMFAQGSLITFTILIGIYVLAMNHLDRKYQIGEKR